MTKGSPADKAGLRGGRTETGTGVPAGGDLIVAVDGKAVRDASEVAAAIAQKQPGDKVEITYYRGDSKKTVTVELAKRPNSARRRRASQRRRADCPSRCACHDRRAMTRVKICGITALEDARLAADLGAWALGMIFWPESPRACPLEQAEVDRRAAAPARRAGRACS